MPEEERTVPTVSLDYAFVRRADEESALTILLAKDRESKAVRAWVMRRKGACLEEASERALEGIQSFGHQQKIIVKVDNEPALKALRSEVMRKLDAGAIPEEPPAGESQSNGGVESAVKLFKGLLRVHLL
eukprot:4656929-Lingulodinium_polyedra.AAC.1